MCALPASGRDRKGRRGPMCACEGVKCQVLVSTCGDTPSGDRGVWGQAEKVKGSSECDTLQV